MIEYLATTIEHHRKSKDPTAWFSVGFSLYLGADLLWKRLCPALDALGTETPISDEQELALRLKGPFAMLAGMAIECMLKGAIIQRMAAAARKGPPRGHNLNTLSEAAAETWDASQIELLARLTTFIVWAGRYPVALTPEQSQASRSLKSTDYVTIVQMAKHLFDIHHGTAA